MSLKYSGSYHIAASEQAGREAPSRNVACFVYLLDDTKEVFHIDRKARGQAIHDLVFDYLELLEREYFGLQFVDTPPSVDGMDNSLYSAQEMRWLDAAKPVRKQLRCAPPYHFYFRVKFYVLEPHRLHEEYTRYHFFLQVKKDILEGRLMCPREQLAILASYAIQSELGDFIPEEMKPGYVSEFRFIASQTADFEGEVSSIHRKRRGLTPASAEREYLACASSLDQYGITTYSAHYDNKVECQLGVSANGVTLFHQRSKLKVFIWDNIIKVSFKRKTFFIQLKKSIPGVDLCALEDMLENPGTSSSIGPGMEPPSGPNLMSFSLMSCRSCKNLWKSCVEYHTFFRLENTPVQSSTSSSLFPLVVGGSKFRFSGRTQYQANEDKKRKAKIERYFARTPSRRYTRRTIAGTTRSALVAERGFGLHTTDGDMATLPLHRSSIRSPPKKLSMTEDDDDGGFRGSGFGSRSGLVSTRGDVQNPSYPFNARTCAPGSNARQIRQLGGTAAYATLPRRASQPAAARGSSAVNGNESIGVTTFGSERTKSQPLQRPVSAAFLPTSTVHSPSLVHGHVQNMVSPSSSAAIITSNVKAIPSTGHISIASSASPANVSTAPQTGQPHLLNGGFEPTVSGGGLYPLSGSAPTAAVTAPTASSTSSGGPVLAGGEGLVTIRIKPDDRGRFGFNVKGGYDQGLPIIVSRVGSGMPADVCIPRLHEGDQVLFINGRDVSTHTHEQVVQFIRSAAEKHSGELVLVVRPSDYIADDMNSDNQSDLAVYNVGSVSTNSAAVTTPASSVTSQSVASPAVPHQIPAKSASIPRPSTGDLLTDSMLQLQEEIETGQALAQFEQLYRRKPGMTMNAARQPENMVKNRYRDISPYDQTRVMIQGAEECGDYINASHVNMEIPKSGILNRYIAAQGPLPHTCADFWQMVWEQQSSLVVMLTASVERGRAKCHQYWPDMYETAEYGGIQLTCLSEQISAAFAFREFLMYHINSREERRVTHMQYINWPDHGVPQESSEFIQFVRRVRSCRAGHVEPVVVHCSAGIGRTGVLITMETAMCLVEANHPVSPLEIVRQMRDQRAMLIQTPSQYQFVCEAVLQVFKEKKENGDTAR